MPAVQSRKTLPSTSSTTAPNPRAMTNGYPRVYEGETTARSRAMMALALGPGSGVLMSGTFIKAKGKAFSLPFPAGSRRPVFENHAACRQIVPNPVGGGKVVAAPGRVAFLDQALDLPDGDGWLIILGTAQAQHAQHGIELVECGANHRQIADPDLARVDRGIERAHELEDRTERRGGIQIV